MLARCWYMPERISLKKSTVNSNLLFRNCASTPKLVLVAVSQRRLDEPTWISVYPVPEFHGPLEVVTISVKYGKRVFIRSLLTVPYEQRNLRKLIKVSASSTSV